MIDKTTKTRKLFYVQFYFRRSVIMVPGNFLYFFLPTNFSTFTIIFCPYSAIYSLKLVSFSPLVSLGFNMPVCGRFSMPTFPIKPPRIVNCFFLILCINLFFIFTLHKLLACCIQCILYIFHPSNTSFLSSISFFNKKIIQFSLLGRWI